MTNELPKTREEYTVWSLEWSGRFHRVYARELTKSSFSMQNLVAWIEYTFENFPDLIALDVHSGGGSFTVSIAGVRLHRFLMTGHASLGRRLMDCEDVTVRRREFRTR